MFLPGKPCWPWVKARFCNDEAMERNRAENAHKCVSAMGKTGISWFKKGCF